MHFIQQAETTFLKLKFFCIVGILEIYDILSCLLEPLVL